MPEIEINGVQLSYRETGDGEPLILVHGSQSDARTWDHLVDRFGEHYRTIVYSRRYHWPNPPIPEGADYAMGQQVDDLEGLVVELGAQSAHVVGHSYGAYLALLLALKNPTLVRSLVLAEPPVLPLFVSAPPSVGELLKLFLRRPRVAMSVAWFGSRGMGPALAAFRRGDEERGLEIFSRAVLGSGAFDALSEDRLEQVRANLIVAEFLGSGFAPITDGEVAQVGQPTLLVESERGPKLFKHLLEHLEKLIGRSERVRIPEASHIMHEDNPEAFYQSIVSFLRREAAPEQGRGDRGGRRALDQALG